METATSDAERIALDLLTRWYAAWDAHDPDAICALVTDDVVYEDPGATEPVTHGRGALRAWAKTAFRAVPDMHLELKGAWVSPGGASAAQPIARRIPAARRMTRKDLRTRPEGGHAPVPATNVIAVDSPERQNRKFARGRKGQHGRSSDQRS